MSGIGDGGLTLLEGQRRILEMVATGAPTADTLAELIAFVEAQEPPIRCGILIVAEDGARFDRGSGPNLPEAYHRHLDGLPITPPYLGSCGEAAHLDRPVTVPDIARDSRYPADWRDLLTSCGLAAVRSTPVRGADGRVLGSFSIYYDTPRDPTPAHPRLIDIATHLAAIALQRGRAEAALRRSEEEFRALGENLPNPCWMADAAGWIYWYNRGWYDYTGTTPAAMAGWGWQSVHDPEVLPAVMERWTGAIAAGQPFEMTFPLRAADGTFRPFLTRIVPVRDADGAITRWFGNNVDVGEQLATLDALRASEDALRRLNEHLEARVAEEIRAREAAQERLAQAQRMEALGQLAGGIAHDFNNVLQAVSGGLSLIQRRADDPGAVRGLAGMVAEAAARGAAITGRLLAFARRSELRAAPVAPLALLEGLREMLAPTLGRTIVVRTEVEADALPLLADGAQLETVLVNLAVNARDAMPEGGVLSLSARAETVADGATHPAGLRAGEYVRLTLADEGRGMDEATLARAGEPFFTTKPVGQGTGLGLAMARGFAEQSDGALAIGSAPGRGTTVTLWFPRAAEPAPRHAVGDPSGPNPASGARVLVVDDDAMVRDVLAGALRDGGFRVAEAHDGLDALARLDGGEAVDLLVTDYSMPGMNGLTLLREARRRLPVLPVVLLTGYSDPRVGLGLEAGADVMLLRKPVSVAELSDRVSALLVPRREAAG